MKRIKLLFTLVATFLSFTLWAQETQPWDIPEDQADKTAPAMFTPDMAKVGKDVYLKTCTSCHGDPGKNNPAKLNPVPSDLASPGVASQSDGTLHYKIVHGKGLMPAFKNTLSATDIWNVIAYIRSFHTDYVQLEPRVIKTFGGSSLKLTLEYLKEELKFKVLAVGVKDEMETPAEGVELALFANRYFGKLQLGESKTTNARGEAFFDVPENLPGNEKGELTLQAKVVDTDTYGDVLTNGVFAAGEPTNKPGLTEKRAMWNVGSMAPWWISLVYPLGVLAVLGTIGYILLLLKKVYSQGNDASDN
ncbi:MAG: cytochrome c [Salinivirgaceae bacterium]